jgi:NADPH:quinone reductase-like Zn-dependent oxidoreductase
MKAACTRYGPPDVVEINDLDKPVPRDNEVLIKVRAASVNPLDWKTMKGGRSSFVYSSGCANQRSNTSALTWLAKSKQLAET